MQAAKRRDLPGTGALHPSDVTVRIGFTASKKVGGAVQRNRAKRRLRALADEVLVPHAKNGVDYVLIARAGTLDRRFDDLRIDMEKAMKRLKVWSSNANQPPRLDRASSE